MKPNIMVLMHRIVKDLLTYLDLIEDVVEEVIDSPVVATVDEQLSDSEMDELHEDIKGEIYLLVQYIW